MTPANTRMVGFTLHTPTSTTIPGRWGVLVLIYEPAAYAEALAAARIEGHGVCVTTKEKS